MMVKWSENYHADIGRKKEDQRAQARYERVPPAMLVASVFEKGEYEDHERYSTVNVAVQITCIRSQCKAILALSVSV